MRIWMAAVIFSLSATLRAEIYTPEGFKQIVEAGRWKAPAMGERAASSSGFIPMEKEDRRIFSMVSDTQEQWTVQNLMWVRKALYDYKKDQGSYPATVQALIPKYLRMKEIPDTVLPTTGHKRKNLVTTIIEPLSSIKELDKRLKDTGGWIYVSNPGGKLDGMFIVDCVHTDSKGFFWYMR